MNLAANALVARTDGWLRGQMATESLESCVLERALRVLMDYFTAAMLSRGPCRPLDSLSMRNVAANGELGRCRAWEAGLLVSYRPLACAPSITGISTESTSTATSTVRIDNDTQSYS